MYNPAIIMLANLRALFGGVVDIVMFRRGPENLPASQTLLAIVVALSIVGSLAMSAVFPLPSPQGLIEPIYGCVFMLLWYRGALALANKRERFLQTMTALFGVNALFIPVMVPLMSALMPYLEKADASVAPPAALILISLAMAVWALAAQIRVVKAAFECPWIGAALLVVGEVIAASIVFAILFGGTAKAAASM